MQSTAEFHDESADPFFPQANPVYDDAAALGTAVDMVDPQPTLVELLVRHVPLPRERLPQIGINSIHRVQLIIAEGNVASERVAQKCGFTYEGTVRQAMFTRGRHFDMKIYSLLRHEVETCLPSRLFSSGTTQHG
jgi:hypothetical protein